VRGLPPVPIPLDMRYAKSGEEKQADFISVVAWRSTAEFVQKYFHKGSQIIVEGRIQTRKWKDNDGNNRYATEIVASQVNFCGSKKDNPIDISADDTAPQTTAPAASVSTGSNDDFVEIAGDDDLPF